MARTFRSPAKKPTNGSITITTATHRSDRQPISRAGENCWGITSSVRQPFAAAVIFSAGLIDGTIRGIAMVYRLLQNPVVRYGIGQGAKKAAENWDRIKQMCKPAAETEVDGIPPGRITSEYTDITTGNSVRNIRTDIGKAEFEANLVESGYAQTVSKDGRTDILTKGDIKYTVREQSNTGVPTAEYFPSGAEKAT